MTILILNKKELEQLSTKVTPELEDKITEMGTPVEDSNENELSIEIFPNRPDLLCLENFALALNQFIGKRRLKEFKVNKAGYKVIIDKSVKKVRPHTACAVVKGLRLDDSKIKRIMDLQEKLHNSIGRKRKKIAMGVYPLDRISMPISFVGKNPNEISFVPLEESKVLNAKKILKEHPKGKEYGHLLEKEEVYPVFVDSKGKILSMPPIINSVDAGKVDEKTKDVFIECSGENLYYLKKCLNILVLFFNEMGGKVYAVDIIDKIDGGFTSPDVSYSAVRFSAKDINKTLGLNLKESEIKKYLLRMGIGTKKEKDSLVALVPPYRMDVLHWIDLAEDVAIAFGYKNFKPEIPRISTIASEDVFEKKSRIVSSILSGLGFLEVSTYHLTTKKDIKRMHFNFNDFLELENSKTFRDVLRIDLLTNFLEIFSENSNSSYPQKIFEIGRVFENDHEGKTETGVIEKDLLAIAISDEKARFTDIKMVADYLFKMLGLEYDILPAENSNYIPGRCAEVIFSGKKIGLMGEIAPRVLKNWKVRFPVAALEINAREILT